MTHMSIEQREIIEDLLKEKYNFTKIAQEIGYHRTTITDEIIKHKRLGKQNTYGTNFVNCEYENTCDNFTGIGCTKKCNNFKPKTCEILSKPPYVCNGCSKRNHCKLQKFFYRAKEAQQEYEQTLTETRSGIQIPEEDIKNINNIIAPLIKEKGQTVNQVYLNHPDLLYFSKTEFYRLIDLGYIDIKNIDLPRKVKYKKRKNEEKRRTRKESSIRLNRTYKDYLDFREKHKDIDAIQMDTVERNKGGKVLLTIHFVKYAFMFMYLLDSQTSENVSKRFRWIQKQLGRERFKKIFSLILTDNGHEFFEPEVIEFIDNEQVSHVFYCDPNRPDQKAECEENHHYISYIFPKGNDLEKSTFDNLTEEDCTTLMSHINSVPRACLKGKTPFESIQHLMTEEELKKLGVHKIPKDDVNLKPDLFKGKVYRK